MIEPIKYLIRIALSAVAFTTGAPGSAAELRAPVNPQSVAAMSLEDLLGVSVSVASRTEETFTQAPSSVTVFTRAEIQSMGVRTIEELLNFAPGFYSGRSANSSYGLGVRGRMSSQLSNDVLFLIDGQRINDDFSDASLLFNRLLTTDNVKQVEIVRGPGSALYGSDALLGVVNIVTDRNLNELRVGLGSNQRREGYLSLSGRVGAADASLFVGGFKDEGESFIDLSSPDLARTRDPQQSLTANLSLGLDHTRVEARLARFQLDNFYIFTFTPSDPNGLYRSSDAWLRASQDLWSGDDGNLTASAQVRRIDHESLVTIFPGEVIEALAAQGWTFGSQDFRAGPVVQQTELGTSLDGKLRLGDRQQLAAGLDFRHTRFDKTLNQNNYETADIARNLPCIDALFGGDDMPWRCNFAFIRPYGRVVESSDFAATGKARDVLGLYVQDEIRLRPDLKATLGVRLDRYSDFGRTVNPRAALVYSPATPTTFKLMYGEAFRAPTVSELDVKNTPDLVGNPDLKPEKIRTIEAAWLQSFAGVQTTLTGYFSRVRDRIEQVPQGGIDPRGTFMNGAGLDLSGIELEIQDQLTEKLLLRGSFSHSFQYAEDPQAVPQDLASFSLNYHHKRLSLNLNGFYHGTAETGATPPAKLDDYWVLNANLRYDLGGVTLTGGVYNLLDEDYYTYTGSALPRGIPNRGRELRVGAEFPL